MYTGENYVEVKREDDGTEITTYPHDDNTGINMFHISKMLLFLYSPVCQPQS